MHLDHQESGSEMIASRDAKERATTLAFCSIYLAMKKQNEGGSDFKSTSGMLKKSLGKHLKAVVSSLEQDLQDMKGEIRGIAAASLLAIQPDHAKALLAFSKYVEEKKTLNDEKREDIIL